MKSTGQTGDRAIRAFIAKFQRTYRQEGDVTREWASLLQGFRAQTREAAMADKSLGRSYAGVVKEWRVIYRDELREHALVAEGLNVFDILGFSTDEVRHSLVLAWLLDRHGSHFQGARFFSLLLSTIGRPLHWAQANYRVDVEQSGEESRIDIRVFAAGSFLIDIEVKVNALPGPQQLLRESRDAISFAKGNGVPEHEVACIYLSRSKVLPAGYGLFSSLSWNDIARMLTQSSKGQCIPVRLQLILENYIDVLHSLENWR